MTKMAGSKFGEDIFVAIWREESVVTWHPKKKYLHFQLSRGWHLKMDEIFDLPRVIPS